MNNTINKEIVSEIIKQSGIADFGSALIFEIAHLVGKLEQETGTSYIRMEMGVPGFSSNKMAVEAEISALLEGVSSVYPPMGGIPKLKEEASIFAKNFLDIDIPPEGCIPTVGSTQGSFAAMMVACKREKGRDAILFLDPGFPLQKQQAGILGCKQYSLDVYNCRGNDLKDKLEEYLSHNKIGTLLYSNPNNPSWVCFSEDELKIIGDLANKYNVVILEDLAYFGMDFRSDLSQPGKSPYQPTIAKYTDNYILLVSGSKVFNYAGQRVALLLISDNLFNKEYPFLNECYASSQLGYALVFGALASLSSGTPHSAQHALYTILKKVNALEYRFIDDIKEYEERASWLKNAFINHGFKIVYDTDSDSQPIADGFYFTISYPGMDGVELFKNLLHYGISIFPLKTTGSTRLEGARVCVSFIKKEQFAEIGRRLNSFHKDFSNY